VTNQSNVYVYELTTKPNLTTEASVGAIALTVLDGRPSAGLFVWTVAATMEQALSFRGLPWIISSRQRGAMVRNGDQLEFRDPESGETLKLSIEALER
jgi:hypothetical protein